jgi:pimeloyl-ACP methyl ester carboxylesterase
MALAGTTSRARLPNGRMIGYAEYGTKDAPPVIYCHGWPTSRLEAGLGPDLNLRLIAPDRPGYGLTDPIPKATLKDQAQDIRHLAGHLGLKRFAVVGVSGGGPLAAACAYYLPDLVSALTLISAVPPPHAVTKGRLATLMRFGRWPALGKPVMTMARDFILAPNRAEAVAYARKLPGRDGAVMTREKRAALLGAMREGLKQGIQGAVTDATIYGHNWGFRLEDITISTTAWQGELDQLIPPQSVQAFRAIPGVTIRDMPGHGHYSLAMGETEMIMAELIRRAEQQA